MVATGEPIVIPEGENPYVRITPKALPAANTAAVAPAAAVDGVLRLPRREAWVDLPQEAYPGWKVRLWLNYPFRLQQEINSLDAERMMAAIKAIVLEHNRWGDEEGEEYPPANSDAFWDAIPTELATVVIALTKTEPAKLGNGLLPTRRGS